MSQPHLVVNCRFLTRPVTGVERFAFEIVARLVDAVDDISLVAPPTIPSGTRIAGKTVQPVGQLRGHLWEQVSLPRYLRSMGSPTLLDLANTGPLLWPNQLYMLHDVAFITHPESYRRAFRLAYRVIAGTLVRRASYVATVSTFSRDEIVRVFRCPEVHIDVVPNGVSTFVSEPGDLDPFALAGRKYFLAVGSAAVHKNTSRLIEAYARVRGQLVDPPALVIVGGEFTRVPRVECHRRSARDHRTRPRLRSTPRTAVCERDGIRLSIAVRGFRHPAPGGTGRGHADRGLAPPSVHRSHRREQRSVVRSGGRRVHLFRPGASRALDRPSNPAHRERRAECETILLGRFGSTTAGDCDGPCSIGRSMSTQDPGSVPGRQSGRMPCASGSEDAST